MDDQKFKRPESILLVVYTVGGETLLLKRRTPPMGIWQSVTGSLRWREEPLTAAIRELREETGLQPECPPRRTGVINRFKIVPEARYLYASGVKENVEHVFTLGLNQTQPVQLNPDEHSDYRWVSLAVAATRVWSWSNRGAILAVLNGTNS